MKKILKALTIPVAMGMAAIMFAGCATDNGVGYANGEESQVADGSMSGGLLDVEFTPNETELDEADRILVDRIKRVLEKEDLYLLLEDPDIVDDLIYLTENASSYLWGFAMREFIIEEWESTHTLLELEELLVAIEYIELINERDNEELGTIALIEMDIIIEWIVSFNDLVMMAQENSGDVPDISLSENRLWNVTIETTAGRIELELDGVNAPQAVASFVYLAQNEFFDLTECHRLTTSGIYVLQCGDPQGTGLGGPGFNFGPIENAPDDDVYEAGVLAMARVGGNAYSMGSQFFIVHEDSVIPSDEVGGYTVFGKVTSGLEVVRDIAADGVDNDWGDGAPNRLVKLLSVTVS